MRTNVLAGSLTLVLSLLGCGAQKSTVSSAPSPSERAAANPLPGMPPVTDPLDIYSADHPGMLAPAVQKFPERVYVPNTESHTVDVIDPATYRVIGHFPVGRQPQHVVPSWDLKTLWVLNDKGNSLTRINPATGKKGETIPVRDPYNMYYTPDGKFAIVVSEALKRLEFYDAGTMKKVNSVLVPCKGVDHMDFSPNGRYLIASCEFEGAVIKFDVEKQQFIAKLEVEMHGQMHEGPHPGMMPQDVKLSPDGLVYYVADMHADGVHLIDGEAFKQLGFIPTGKGAHGLYASRDSKYLYVSNRGEGSVSVIDFKERKVAKKWQIPGRPASPDMGGVSADGKVLWLAGRYHQEVYAIDTKDGHLRARIKVGRGPHGLCIYPQPGRYSLGHTGVFR